MWTRRALRDLITDRMKDYRFIVVANREPVIHDRAADGTIRERQPASGVVTALEPLSIACDGTA